MKWKKNKTIVCQKRYKRRFYTVTYIRCEGFPPNSANIPWIRYWFQNGELDEAGYPSAFSMRFDDFSFNSRIIQRQRTKAIASLPVLPALVAAATTVTALTTVCLYMFV